MKFLTLVLFFQSLTSFAATISFQLSPDDFLPGTKVEFVSHQGQSYVATTEADRTGYSVNAVTNRDQIDLNIAGFGISFDNLKKYGYEISYSTQYKMVEIVAFEQLNKKFIKFKVRSGIYPKPMDEYVFEIENTDRLKLVDPSSRVEVGSLSFHINKVSSFFPVLVIDKVSILNLK